MDFFLEGLIGAIVWTFANVVYADLRRKGKREGRLLSFFVGYPGTLISLFAVREGRALGRMPAEAEEDQLLQEIRVDLEQRDCPPRGGRRPRRAR